MNNTRIYIGADGGGTKILYCLKAGDKSFYLRKDYSVNPNDVGFEESVSRVVGGMAEICYINGIMTEDVRGVFAGIAGGSTANYREILKAGLDKVFISSVNGVSHDGENILYAAFPDTDGVIVICGTGSSCFYKKGNNIFRIGGYSLFDLEGNGYEMGKKAIAHALKCVDGREKRGVLCSLVEIQCGGNCLDNLKKLLSLPIKEIASFAPLVFKAAAENDRYAQNIINSVAEYLAECINHASKTFDGICPVCIAGSIGTHPITLEKLKPKLFEKVTLTTLTKEPVEGAVYKAKLLSKTR